MATGDIKIEHTNIKTAPGVELSSDQKTIVGSVLDLFVGRPSDEKLDLWTDEAVFEDPLTQARGRKEFEAQWYGLQTAFSEIERVSHEVTSSGNPITMSLKMRYVVKGFNQETVIRSIVNISTDSAGMIIKVEDQWAGNLPKTSTTNAFRRLNALSVPKMVNVHKDDEEDAKMGTE